MIKLTCCILDVDAIYGCLDGSNALRNWLFSHAETGDIYVCSHTLQELRERSPEVEKIITQAGVIVLKNEETDFFEAVDLMDACDGECDEMSVQERGLKFLLLAKARRISAFVVTGEAVSVSITLSALCALTGMEYIFVSDVI